MNSGTDSELIAKQETLERLSRWGDDRINEVSIVASTGARVSAWAVKVKSLSEYNIYNVRTVEISSPGWEPTEIGQETQAFNLAEAFDQSGQLSIGTYVVMFRVGEHNVFYAPV